jgi:rubrerythrin
MTQKPASPVKDKNYDLITVLQVALRSVWKTETYAGDAEREGDSELADWFRRIQDFNRTIADQGKQMLRRRLQGEESGRGTRVGWLAVAGGFVQRQSAAADHPDQRSTSMASTGPVGGSRWYWA